MNKFLVQPFGLLLSLAFIVSACSQNQPAMPEKTSHGPEWTKEAIWYQIFAERFYNGDETNNPTPADIADPFLNNYAPEKWQVTPWEHPWHEPDAWMKHNKLDVRNSIYFRRYGGDLKGVMLKLEYLQELGINAIYFNPLNDASSLHKYDARYYHHIDVNFGPDPEGDKKIIAQENPNDPNTWEWTSADKLFLDLLMECKKRGIRVVLDYSWNHTGTNFWAWQDIVAKGKNSEFADWYAIEDIDEQSGKIKYHGWLGVMSLPELTKVDVVGERKAGHPYSGNLHLAVKKHVFDVSHRWLAPNGDVSAGVDGYRLDVADHLGLDFWRDYYQFVKGINPDAYLVGEIWWQQWPNTFMNPEPYLQGDIFDAVMFYHSYRPARAFFAQTEDSISAQQFRDSLQFQWNRIGMEKVPYQMNVASSHDTPRLLSCFGNPNKYKFKSTPNDDPNYNTAKPNEETFKRVQLYLLFQFTIPGAPHIWNGEEMGMWGADDPHCRKPLMWPEFTFAPEKKSMYSDNPQGFDQVAFNKEHFEYYKTLIKLRKAFPALAHGEIRFLKSEGDVVVYSRNHKDQKLRILLNRGKDNISIDLPKNTNFIDAITGSKVSESIDLSGFSGRVIVEQ